MIVLTRNGTLLEWLFRVEMCVCVVLQFVSAAAVPSQPSPPPPDESEDADDLVSATHLSRAPPAY